MQTPNEINFATFYFNELLKTIRNKASESYDEEAQTYLNRLIDSLQVRENAHDSIETLAASQSTSDLAIFFSDILDQLDSNSPDEAMGKLGDRADDFLEIFEIYCQNDEWKATLQQELAMQETASSAEAEAEEESISLEAFCKHIIDETIDSAKAGLPEDIQPAYVDYLNAFLNEPQKIEALSNTIDDPRISEFANLNTKIINKEGEGDVKEFMGNFGGSVQQWAVLFKEILQDHPDALNAVFQPAAEMPSLETESQISATTEAESEQPFEQLFDQIEEEFKEPEAETAESTENIEELVSGAEQLENRPRQQKTLSQDEIDRRKMLRDYVANEIASFTEEVMEMINQLADSPGNSEKATRLQDSLKSLKDIGQIHHYPAVEETADTLLQLFNQLQQQGQSFSKEDISSLEAIFAILPIYVDAAVENLDNNYHTEIHQELVELRSRLFQDEPVSGIKASETMEAAFQDVVRRYAVQINEFLAASGNGASDQPLSPIFENLSYWSSLLVSQEATTTVGKVQQLTTGETLSKLSGAERQVVSDIVTSWESDFVNTSGELWHDYTTKLDELLQSLDGVGVTEAAEAYHQVCNLQLSQLTGELQSDVVSITDFLQVQLPNFLTNLQTNSALVKNDSIENLCQSLNNELSNVDIQALSQDTTAKDRLSHFLESLKANFSDASGALESDSLAAEFRNSLAVEETPAATEIASENESVTEEKAAIDSDIEFAIEETSESDIGLADEMIAAPPELAESQPSEAELQQPPSEGMATDDEIIEVFNLEALNYIKDLKDCFARLRTNLNDKDAWSTLGITAHTLKGSAQMVGRSDIAELAEPLDQVVELTQGNMITVQPELVTIFDSLADVMKEKTKDPSVKSGPVISQLRDYISLATKQAAAPQPASHRQPDSTTATTSSEMIYLKEQDPELLNIFQNEVSNNFDIVEKNLTNLEKFTYDKEALQQVERAVHEIRAAAKMLGIGEIATISDKLENIFEMLVLKKIDDLKGVLPFTRRSMVVIRELTTRHAVQKDFYDEIVNNLTQITEGVAPSELAITVTPSAPQFEPVESEIVAPDAPPQEEIADEVETIVEAIENADTVPEAVAAEATSEEKPPASVAPQVLELYIQEAREQLDDINYLLLKLEKDPDNEEMQHHLMRCMHTLKGSSGMVYASNIESLSHRCEDILEKNIKESLTMEQGLFDLLFEVVDEINFTLDAVQENGQESVKNHAQLLSRLNGYYTGGEVAEKTETASATTETAPASAEAQTAAVPAATSSGRKDTYLRLNINKMNHLLNLAAELVISNNQFKNQLDGLKHFNAIMNTNLKTFRDTEEFLGNILKDSHNLKDTIEPLIQQQPAATGSMNEQVESLQRVLKNVKTLQDELTSVSHSLKENSKTYDENLQKLNKLSNDLLDEIMQARLVPINLLFQRFHRPIRDLARQLKKQIRLSLSGEETELDRTLVDELYEPLLHIIRNAIDHGLETEEDRKAAGKDSEGLISIKASRDRNQVIIEVSDDGKGIDLEAVKQSAIQKGLLTTEDAANMNEQELFEYLFYPGFSTAKETTLVSGRGVGLDAVKAQIDKAKGDIRMYTEKGKGTTFSIRVPISLSVIQSMLVDVGGHIYSIPLMQVEETLHASGQDLISENDRHFIRFREKKFPLVQLSSLLKVRGDQKPAISTTINYPVIIVQDEGESVALLVDKIIRREEILIKSLGPGLRRLKYISGGSIMADGQVVLVLDIPQLIQDIIKGSTQKSATGETAKADAATGISPATPRGKREVKQIEGRKPVALIVDDSLSIRKYLSSLLMQKGYITDTARNGYEALELLNKQDFDIMVTDLEMPKLSGYELIETLRYDQRFSDFPIIVLTGRAGDNFRQLTAELGADAYVIKPFKDRELFDQLEKFIEYNA